MSDGANIKRLGLLSLYGLSLVWSPMFGTSEAMVFSSLSPYSTMLLFSRMCNLAAFGIVMAVFSLAGERLKKYRAKGGPIVAVIALGFSGMLVGALVGMETLPLNMLPFGGFLRGLFYGILTVSWIDVLIRLEDSFIGSAVSAALLLYAIVGLIIVGAALLAPALALVLLAACPVLSCTGCLAVAKRAGAQAPIDQESTRAPFHTRCLLYAANLLFGIMLGALLYYFARFDTPESIVAFSVMALFLFFIFTLGANRLEHNTVYRGFMLCFAISISLVLLLGRLNASVAVFVASATLAFLILYTVIIFTDTQARMRNPFWKVPGMCQVFAAAGMIVSAAVFQTVFPEGDVGDTQLVLLAAACVVFVAGVFSPSERTRMRPWGFSSLIPAESPEERSLRRCGELAEEHGLTSRELEILQLLAAGRTKDQIAETLVISPTTAKTHIRNIYAKLSVHSQRELANKIDS